MNVLRGENRFGFRGQLTLDFPDGKGFILRFHPFRVPVSVPNLQPRRYLRIPGADPHPKVYGIFPVSLQGLIISDTFTDRVIRHSILQYNLTCRD